MKLTTDFFNKLGAELDKKYFPEVRYYRDNKNDEKVHYALECFSNGVLTYNKLIKTISINCKDTKENIHKIVSKYIANFEGFEYSFAKCNTSKWKGTKGELKELIDNAKK